MRAAAAVTVLLAGGCTTLGPMPATTLVSPVPSGAPGVEVGLGAVPGYYLSSGTTDEHKGTAMPQLAALFEPDRLIGIPGLFAAVRVVGPEDSGPYGEPMIGYRRSLGDFLSLGVVGFGTHAGGSRRKASYSATRLGGEVSADVRVTPRSKWVELHFQAGASATGILADGTYCVDSELKYGVDCPEEGDPMGPVLDASASGLYPSAHAGAIVAFGQNLGGIFHGGRVSLVAAGGTMPTVIGGVQDKADTYASLGLSLSLGLGAAREQPPAP